MAKHKMTRQGVRDLNHIKGKSRGVVLEMPPEQLMPRSEVRCTHPRLLDLAYGFECAVCERKLDPRGKEMR